MKWTQIGIRFHFHMRGEMNSNRYKISFRLKILLRSSFSSLLVFTWIEAKWNSKRYEFHIILLDRNEISNRLEILCEHNLPQTKWISADSLDVAFNTHVRLKLNAGMDFISVTLTEIEFHVYRTSFHTGLKYETDMSSFRLSCERTLSFSLLSNASFNYALILNIVT